jgi:dual oxidase
LKSKCLKCVDNFFKIINKNVLELNQIVAICIADSHLTRKVPATYADGVYMMGGDNRPNARKLSELFMKGPDGLGSVMNRTALFAFFGTCLLLCFVQKRNAL